ncbi:MAG: Clp1/GlmU family protein [Bacillota bacterium]
MGGFPAGWGEIADALLVQARLVILIGPVDTGKSTLTVYLANRSRQMGYTTAVVDADVGQSDIGPPTTIGLGIVRAEVEQLEQVPPVDLYFVGSTTPYGHVAEMVVGTKRMVDRAFALGAQRVLVNTTGLIHGELGQALKYHKVDLLRPDAIIGLQRRGEAECLLRIWEALGYRIYRLPVDPRVRRRPLEVRAAFRRRRWREYFGGSTLRKIKLGDIVIRRAPVCTGVPLGPEERRTIGELMGQPVLWAEKNRDTAVIVTPELPAREAIIDVAACLGVRRVARVMSEHFTGLVISLVGESGRVLSLGCIAGLDYEEGALLVYAPCRGGEKVRLVEFGRERLDVSDFLDEAVHRHVGSRA